MKTIECRFVDKSQWDRGVWDSEPDKVQWQDPETGLPCLTVRNKSTGNWCGYVGVAESHPYFDKEYDQLDIDCHGGLTFSNFCQEDEKEHGICHVPATGEPDRVWWLGFDCGHAGDLIPGLMATMKQIGGQLWSRDIYRDLAFVQKECAQIAQQLRAIRANEH